MSDKPKFFLAPSKLGRSSGTEESQATTKPNFTGTDHVLIRIRGCVLLYVSQKWILI